MSDKDRKPAIPAWQQAATSQDTPAAAPAQAPVAAPEADAMTTEQTVTSTPDMAAAAPSPPQLDNGNEADQREQIRTFLKEPAVTSQDEEKKRIFLQSKGMPAHLVEEELRAQRTTNTLDTTDFQSFKDASTQQERPSAGEVVQQSPPIITYPEFLADAHRSPPLITPTRILATTYVASAAAVLTYAASTFLVKPMLAQLTDARHEFAEHSNSKVRELNQRLEKLVSQIPGAKLSKQDDDDDSSSVSSDPTELFSRDTGTQTDVAAQIEPSAKVTILEPTASSKQVEKLTSLENQLSDMLASAQKEGRATEEREANVKKLRHYLDGLAYGGSGLNVWNNTGGQFSWEQTTEQQKDKDKRSDAIEELKKEIRGVKGVLLSAKRFPAAARGSTGAGTQFQYAGKSGVAGAA